MPASARPFAYLARLDRPIGIWLLALPGWWAIVLASGGVLHMNAGDWGVFTLFGIGAVVMRSAGCVVNDLWDRDLDKKVERTTLRPLAAGTITPVQAFIFLAALLILGLVILLQMNFITILLGVLSIPLIVVYPLMKRLTYWPQAFLGLTFNFGALMGWAAVTGTVGSHALLLYAAGIFWTLAYDTIYAHQDKEDDLLAGVKSSALKLGEKSRAYVSAFFVITLLLFLLAAQKPLVLIPVSLHAYWQIKNWNENDQASSLRIFKSNREFGFLALLGFAFVAL